MLYNKTQDLDKIISNAIKNFDDIQTGWNDSVQKTFYEHHIAPLITTLRQIRGESESIYQEFLELKMKINNMEGC